MQIGTDRSPLATNAFEHVAPVARVGVPNASKCKYRCYDDDGRFLAVFNGDSCDTGRTLAGRRIFFSKNNIGSKRLVHIDIDLEVPRKCCKVLQTVALNPRITEPAASLRAGRLAPLRCG